MGEAMGDGFGSVVAITRTSITEGRRERSPRRLAVLIVEQHEIARAGLHSMLNSLPFVGDVRSTVSTPSGREMLMDRRADVVLVSVDIHDPALVPLMPAERRRTRTLLLIRSHDRGALEAAARLSVDGFLMEPDLTTKTLSDAFVSLACGETPMPAALADHLLEQARSRGNTSKVANLTPCERRVLGLLVEGKTNKEIATELSVSQHGVKRHVANLLAKMHAPNRTQAVAKALSEGLLLPVEG
jgi:DNA-binding NarL/FixJ family response regulator